jgi:hypothetical protein
MAGSLFSGFSKFSRPDVGLVSDSSRNLSEIFESDKREALRNILLFPEVLDSIYKVSESVSVEDIRATSGLSRLLLPSLDQIDEIAADRIPGRLYVDKEFFSPTYPLGGIGASGVSNSNVIIFNGALQCYGAEYFSNTIGDSIFSGPVPRRIALSTSRSSLLSAEANPDFPGYIKTARYPGTIKVRRRSHVNRIFVPKTSFISRSNADENPTHSILVNVDNGNTGSNTTVRLLATKNTPLRVYCRMTTGKIRFKFTDANAPYFFGYQIQPAQQRPNSSPVDFLPLVSLPQPVGDIDHEVNIDISETGYQNLYDLYLYLYVTPEKVKEIEFSGIDIREFPDQKDLGLIGFNSLEYFKVSGGSMTILPLWLKTRKTTLKTLDLSGSGDVWRNGPMGWFDIRDASATPTPTHPQYTAVSYLTIPQSGSLVNSDGDDWRGSSGSGGTRVVGKFEKYITNQSRTANTDYRQFTNLSILRLGGRFYGKNPRLDDVFPNLIELSWGYNGNVTLLSGGKPPKINNNGSLIFYSIAGAGNVSGSLTDIGTSETTSDPGHISNYSFSSFLVNGLWWRPHYNLTGYINNWSSWLDNSVSIDISYTGVSINLQTSTWRNLRQLEASYSDGAKFDSSSSVLSAPNLQSLSLYSSDTTGKLPKLGSESDTRSLESINIGACNSIGASDTYYLLPSDFAEPRAEGVEHKLKSFSASDFSPSYQLRSTDFENLVSLESVNFVRSGLTGKFPLFPTKQSVSKSVSINISGANFIDLRSLSINSSDEFFARDVRSLYLDNQNVSGGGCVLPQFIGTTGTGIQGVEMSNSLPTVISSLGSSSLSGLSVSTVGEITQITGSTQFKGSVLVNDFVRKDSATGDIVARVLSVFSDKIYVEILDPGTLPSTLYFTRNPVDISDWFSSGFKSLLWFRARNCRLSGHLNIRDGFESIFNESGQPALDLKRNLISEVSNLSAIFTTNARAVTIDLSENNLSPLAIREIITNIAAVDKDSFRNSRVFLSSNKIEGTEYKPYSQNEIFPVTISQGPDTLTQLSRNESFDIYEKKSTFNEQGAEIESYQKIATTTIRVAGELSSGTYYKVKIQKTQITTENPVAVVYKNLKNIKVDLGFPYVSPGTNPIPLSSEYDLTSTISRNQSIEDAGLTPLPSCPNGVPGTSCWENSSKQVLKLN